jgi:PncC family amidohydrolase
LVVFVLYNGFMTDESLEIKILELMRPTGLTLGVAESCTGGLVSHRITNVPGASEYFLGGVVSYGNEVKTQLLGVRTQTLAAHGAVSEQTVLEMAYGVRRLLSTDIGAAVSGIAGPGGATHDKPVGLVWIGLSAPGFEQAWQYIWQGDRLAVKQQSAEAVLRHIVEYLRRAREDGSAEDPTREE